MQRDILMKTIKDYEDEFKKFIGANEFPVYELQTHEVSLEVADSRGYDSAACTYYEPQNKKHTLCVSTNLILSEYLVFHEFTHMLDSEMYVKDDKMRYAGLSGFTEYHASQVELAKMLRADTINKVPSFSMDTEIETFAGVKSVSQYVGMKQQHAIDLFSRIDFPKDIETLESAVGVLHNYFGLRSICEMYSTDYVENINNRVFLKFISTQEFAVLNRLMHGWFDENKIDLSIKIYINIVFPLIKQFRLA